MGSGKMSDMETTKDGRGFSKTENFQVMNPNEANFQTEVNLVERNTCPNGVALVDADKSGKVNQFDLVELAQQIQTADKFTRATAGSKLQVIAEQERAHSAAASFKMAKIVSKNFRTPMRTPSCKAS